MRQDMSLAATDSNKSVMGFMGIIREEKRRGESQLQVKQ